MNHVNFHNLRYINFMTVKTEIGHDCVNVLQLLHNVFFNTLSLKRSRDKYTVTFHRVILSVYLYEQASLHSCFHNLWRLNDFTITSKIEGHRSFVHVSSVFE